MKPTPIPKYKSPSPERSRTMRAVKGRDTTPERRVRRLVHGLGFRFALHRRDLPGAPDIVLPRLKATVLVHGCFWHGHDCARGSRVPKTNRAYWTAKIACNRARDRASLAALRQLGWRALVIWECDLKDDARLIARLSRFLKRCAQAPQGGRQAR